MLDVTPKTKDLSNVFVGKDNPKRHVSIFKCEILVNNSPAIKATENALKVLTAS
jgi:hypothetical protein